VDSNSVIECNMAISLWQQWWIHGSRTKGVLVGEIEIKRDIGRKSWFFYTPYIRRPVKGLCRSTAISFGLENGKNYGGATRRWKNVEGMYNRLDRITACDRQTDGRTDRRTDAGTMMADYPFQLQTSCDGIVRAMHTRRAVKITIFDQYIALSRKWCKIDP